MANMKYNLLVREKKKGWFTTLIAVSKGHDYYTDIVRNTNLSKTTVRSRLEVLESEGFIERYDKPPDEEGRTGYRITDDGEGLMEYISEVFRDGAT